MKMKMILRMMGKFVVEKIHIYVQLLIFLFVFLARQFSLNRINQRMYDDAEDSGEEMSEDETPIINSSTASASKKSQPPPMIALNLARISSSQAKKTEAKSSAAASTPIFDTAERLLNPQLNKDKKKLLKQMKKKGRIPKVAAGQTKMNRQAWNEFKVEKETNN